MSALIVLQSAAGYYIGRVTADGEPYSRDSAEYYLTKSEADIALATNSFTQRQECLYD